MGEIVNKNLVLERDELNEFTTLLVERVKNESPIIVRLRNGGLAEVVDVDTQKDENGESNYFNGKFVGENKWWYADGSSPTSNELDIITLVK